ncbi:Heat shock cognate 71 kDa protein [Rhizophlyctis rosea]|uniref:Heat shock cognate 71 kDa protein n=1 Tax=Rhizophlyctis rosea TaxID=64517 RepID=A0AAD5SFS4_9FUNG|nr:Heat shock cognate 71 kDa protein [Rhizophlyctis rosea]
MTVEESKAEATFIGIAFGTLYSSVSVLTNGKAHSIANEDGERNIPSYFAFTGHEELAGTQAKVQSMSNPRGTIVQFRNLLGKQIEDEETQLHSRTLGLNIVPSPSDPNTPAYEVENWSDLDAEEPTREVHTVREVTSKYLAKLRETAEAYLGKSVDGVVISIPPHFEDAQKAALLVATKQAGFKKAHAIHEPVAAALAFDAAPRLNNQSATPKNDRIIAVLDLGGHQFNVSVLTASDGLYSILASRDDYALGGVHFDQLLVDFVKQEFKRKTKMDISDNKRAVAKLRMAAEQTKRALTRQDVAPCSVESLYEGMDHHGTINRGRFEMLADPLYRRCSQLVLETLKEAGVNVGEVDEVLFVGGSSRMPRFQAVMKSLFPGAGSNTEIRTDVDPDEAISVGCASQAGIITSSNVDYATALKDVKEAPVLGKSVGIEVAGGAFAVLIPKNTVLPARRTVEFGISEEGQKEIFLAVYEGEESMAKSNTLLAEVALELSEGVKKGEGKVDVTFTIEGDQSFTVAAKEKGKGSASIKVKVAHK